jgi:hypothetical protein
MGFNLFFRDLEFTDLRNITFRPLIGARLEVPMSRAH